MFYRDYRKLRQKTSARLARARIGGIVAVQSGDWRESVVEHTSFYDPAQVTVVQALLNSQIV